jgi:transposase
MRKRVALMNTVRGFVLQEGVKLPVKFFCRSDWQSELARKRMSSTLRAILEQFRPAIEALEESEAALKARIEAVEDPRLELLETIPGIGPLTSRTLLGALDQAERFDSKKSVAKYGALTPTIRQSGDKKHVGHIGHDGRREVRRVLLQCAHTIPRQTSAAAAPLRSFYERLVRRRGKKIAVVALARKLLTIAYAVMRRGEPYDPSQLLPRVA